MILYKPVHLTRDFDRQFARIPECHAILENPVWPSAITSIRPKWRWSGAVSAPAWRYRWRWSARSIRWWLITPYDANLAITPLKRMASYADQDRGHTLLTNESTTSWVVGANYTIGNAGTMLLGYGRKMPDGVTSTRQWSLGYEYPLSKRTYFYADASDKEADHIVRALVLHFKISQEKLI